MSQFHDKATQILEAAIHFETKPDKFNGLSKTQALAQLEALKNEAELKARLVELDLYEQFLNQHSNKGITRGDLYTFKMNRLKDLEKRLDELTAQQKGREV